MSDFKYCTNCQSMRRADTGHWHVTRSSKRWRCKECHALRNRPTPKEEKKLYHLPILTPLGELDHG